MPTLLLVEDNLSLREMLGEHLERKKYTVVFAENGREALEKAAAQLPDLIIMDISMPEMDGLTATRALKADARLSRIPVLILTAHAYAEDEAQARAAGCDDYASKPINFSELHRKIVALIKAENL